MSLRWDAKECDEKAIDGDKAKLITKAIALLTMPVGIGRITEKNYEEFFRRASAYESAVGAFITNWTGKEFVDEPVTLADVKLRIGLWSNASPLTRAAFDRGLKQITKH